MRGSRNTADKAAHAGLARSLSLTHSVLYGLGVTIGAGIYVLVGIAAGRSGMQAPLAFVMAAGVMALTAASFAELGTRMPVSASEAAYVDAAFDRRWFTIVTGLLVVLTATISGATISAGSAGYIGAFLDLPDPWIVAVVVIAMGAIASLATVQSVTFAAILTVIEVAGLLLIIGVGVSSGTHVFTRLPEVVPFSGNMEWVSPILGSTLIAVFAFIGFEHLVNVAEEMKEPTRTLPRALFLTLGITTLIYVLVVWIAVVTVPPSELASSSAPLAVVFQRLTGLPLMTLGIIAIVATLNGIVVHMIMIGRVLYGMAQQGNLPSALGTVHQRSRAPLLATSAGVVGILVFALTIPLAGLADLAARTTLVIFTIVNAALIRIKMRGPPKQPGAFACPLPVAFCGLASCLFLLVADLFL